MSEGALTRERIEAGDPQGMLGDVLAQPHQIGDALWRTDAADIPRAERSGGLVVAGMGGSAIGAELAAAALGRRATAPVRAVRGYELEPWTTPDTLVLCASYSGDTEETLACFDDATERGIPRAVLTTGGTLAQRAREEGVPVIGVPAGMMPRAAVVYMVVAALECAAACGAGPSLRAEIEAAPVLLERLAGEWGPNSAGDSLPKAIADELANTIPVVYGAGPTAAAAMRWKNQLNENSKLPAFWSELPEADHNEVCGWERGRELGPLTSIFLDDPALDARVRDRFEPTARITASGGRIVEPEGETPFERLMSLVFLGDLVSIYAAVLEGEDPTAIEAIEELKAELG
jgi:glucose/mannose-6-phosphate isomerase